MSIQKAVIPLAGLGTRLYPVSTVIPKGLLPFVLADGSVATGIQLIIEDALRAGIEKICLVVHPESLEQYQRFFDGYIDRYAAALALKPELSRQRERLVEMKARIEYAFQDRPLGFGHAVWCASDFADGDPALVLLGDHLVISDGESCSAQLMRAYDTVGATTIGVHRIDASRVNLYGILRGQATTDPELYEALDIVEKPTERLAADQLQTQTLPSGQFLAHFGLFAFTGGIWGALDELVGSHSDDEEIQLTTAERMLVDREPCYAYEIDGSSLDFGIASGYAEAFQSVSRSVFPSQLTVSS